MDDVAYWRGRALLAGLNDPVDLWGDVDSLGGVGRFGGQRGDEDGVGRTGVIGVCQRGMVGPEVFLNVDRQRDGALDAVE
ncbi:MAG: hypothetical protein ACRDR6_12130 [Pseudonocardiaceae bacterium]